MHSFKDTTGREWQLSLNMATKIALRRDCGVDLYKLREDEFGKLIEFLSDDEAVLRMLWHMVSGQGDGLTEEAFYAAMTLRELDAAADAFVEELCDFFSVAAGTILRKLMQAGQQLRTQGMAALNSLTADQIVTDAMKTLVASGAPPTTNATSSNAPASLAASAAPGSVSSATGKSRRRRSVGRAKSGGGSVP